MKIVVLAGGISSERQVSIVSGRDVCRALRKNGHLAILIDVYCGIDEIPGGECFPETYSVDDAAAYIHSFDDSLAETKKRRREFFGPRVVELCQMADMVFLALHGENGEDGRIQAFLELMGIPYTGTGPMGSAIAMDKGITKEIFVGSGVPTPRGILLKKNARSTALSDFQMELPVVVKPCCGGSSVGVVIAQTLEEYEASLAENFSGGDDVIVEEYIRGREFSVGLLDGKALPIIEIQPLEGFYNYENKYKKGAAIETCPADLSPELTIRMQRLAEKGYRALHLEAYARLDFMMNDDGEMYCLEANTLPGMTPTSLLPQEALAVGMDFAALCEELIRLSMKKGGEA